MTSDDLATRNGEIKAIFDKVHGSPIELVLALAELGGVTDQALIAKAMSRSVRSVQAAKQVAQDAAGCTQRAARRAAGCTQPAAPTQRAAQENAAGCAVEKKGFPPNPLPKEITTSPRTNRSAVSQNARENSADTTLHDSKELLRKLREAAGDSLDPLHWGTQHVAIPKTWIASGADIELDVIPVIQARSSSIPRHSVKTWAYFTGIVATAVAQRKAGLPVVSVSASRSRSDDFSEMRKALDAVIGGHA